MSIYLSGVGDRLMDPLNYTGGIREYLAAERQLLLQLARPYAAIIEACCTTGRYAIDSITAGKKYTGIDIASHHIDEAIKLHGDNTARFICADISDLETILQDMVPVSDCLLVFPFNAFGNLEDGVMMLSILKRLKINFAILTYSTTSKAAEARREYYNESGFGQLVLSDETAGVRFTDELGLDTIAYRETWFSKISGELQIDIRCVSFGEIGKAYLNF